MLVLRVKKYGHHVTECRKEEKAKKEKDKKRKTKKKQDAVDIKTSNFTRFNDRGKNGKTRN